MVEPRDSLLRDAPCSAARHHRLGASAIQVRQYARGRAGKAAIRPVLHQERLNRIGCADPVPNDQDRAPWTGCKMTWVFWAAAALVVYTYFGYPAALWLRARLFPRPILREALAPIISIAMVVRNEDQVLEKKLQNLLDLEYPQDHCQIVVVSDGSTDGTDQILKRYAENPRV